MFSLAQGRYSSSTYFMTRACGTPFARVCWIMPWCGDAKSTVMDGWRR